MRIFHKLLALIAGAAVLPLVVSALVVRWRAAELGDRLGSAVRGTGRQAVETARGALAREARRSQALIVRAKAGELESFFHAVSDTLELQGELLRAALRGEPPSPALPLFEGNPFMEALGAPEGGWARRLHRKEPYVLYHVAPGADPASVRGPLERTARLGVLFAHNQRTLPWILTSYVGLPQGAIAGYPGRGPFPKDYDPRDRPWYLKAVDRGRLVWTDLYLDKDGKTFVITWARPVREGGRLLGVVAIDLRLSETLSRLLDMGDLPVTHAALVDDGGDVRIGAAYRGGKAEVSAPVRVALSKVFGGVLSTAASRLEDEPREFGTLALGADGLPLEDLERAEGAVLFSHADVVMGERGAKPVRWRFLLRSPLAPVVEPALRTSSEMDSLNLGLERELSSEVRAVALQLAGVGLGLVLAGLWVAAWAARKAASPLERMAAAARRIGRGDLEQSVDHSSQDEIGELAGAINEMVKGLKEGLFVKQTFKRYVAASVVDRILAHPEELKLGGEKRMLTVFFSDLSGFTEISEHLSPERLVEVINQYLGDMTECIFRHEGTLDKYEGDAVMAFWGAPVAQPDHALRACRAALESLTALHVLWDDWSRRGLPRLDVKIGLNTGPMVVGNIGSTVHMDYTVMGDAVNLGSRLEGANKLYGTHILLSEETRREAGDGIEVRELDLLAVKGKSRPIRVYELLGLKGGVPEGLLGAAESFAAGAAAFRERRWDEAERLLREAQRLRPGDRAAGVFMERIAAFRQAPPPPDWDGVFRATTK